LASGSLDTTVVIWDAKSGERLKTLKGHSDYVYSVSCSPDGKYFASGSRDKNVKIWEENKRYFKLITDFKLPEGFTPAA
jgi:WD40 repeat protein